MIKKKKVEIGKTTKKRRKEGNKEGVESMEENNKTKIKCK